MMKRIIVVIILIWLFSFDVYAQDNDLIRAANAYSVGDYAATINILEQAIANGTYNGSIFLNLGHAYFQSGDAGRALLNYRRAQQYFPRDVELQTQIARIRANRVDGTNESVLPLELIAESTESFSVSELALLPLIFWIAISLLGLAYLLRSQWRSTLRVGWILLIVPLALSIALFGVRYWQETSRPAAVIIVDTVTVRSGPGENYLTFFELHNAAEVRIIESRRDWVRFTMPTGQQGWIETSALATLQLNSMPLAAPVDS